MGGACAVTGLQLDWSYTGPALLQSEKQVTTSVVLSPICGLPVFNSLSRGRKPHTLSDYSDSPSFG